MAKIMLASASRLAIDGSSPVAGSGGKVRISGTRTLKLRDKLFLSYALLSVAILMAAAWVIDRQVLEQVRAQVREEMKTSLPLYDAVWKEQAGRLSALGMAMAGSPIVKTIFGDPRASRDAETIRQMLSDFGQQLSEDVDLVVITDGAGNVVFVEDRRSGQSARLGELPSARLVAGSQKAAESFELLDGHLFHLALSPVISHSGNTEVNNTLVVLVAGSELDRRMAEKLKQRAGSNVLFFSKGTLYSSSLAAGTEASARKILSSLTGQGGNEETTELVIAGDSNLAFARRLDSLGGRPAGHVVVLHSLGRAGTLFRAISSRLLLIGTVSIVLVLFVSFFIARRVTQPIESLVIGAREFGRGNYEHPIDISHDGEFGQLASAFEQMRLSIREGQAALLRGERLATIGQMASSIIHDLRSPLAAMSTAAEVFARAELRPEKRRLLADSQLQAARRMQGMLQDMLEFARGRYAIKLERRELASLLEEVTRETIAAHSQGVTTDVQVPAGICVCVDYERIRRVFVNLLINSLESMPEGGTIRIFTALEGQRVRIHIVDTGVGIPPHIRERLFEPFASTGKQGGTGLGLAIASSIADAHGGSLRLASDANESTDFCVELPLAPEGTV